MTTQDEAAAEAAPDEFDIELQGLDPKQPRAIELESPVTWGGKEYRELKLRPATGNAMKMLPANSDKMTLGHIMDVAARLAGVADGVVGELSGRDLTRVMRTAAFFLQAFRKTGAPS